MKTLYVENLERGLVINGETFAVQEVKHNETKDKRPYYRITLADKTGSINGQVWPDNMNNVERDSLKVGRVVMIDATVEEYKGSLQLNIMKISRVDEMLLDEYMESSDFDLDELWKDLEAYLAKIENPEIKKFLATIFADEDLKKKYKIAPAAESVHHSFRGGLLEHVLEMLDLANALKKYYQEADFDLVVAGIVLHDIGKLYELQNVGAVVQRTTEGQLLGHLIISYEILLKYGQDTLPEEILLNLKHIILAHHGVLEYGSPVLPATIEAAMVHAVDDASSQVRIYQRTLRRSRNREGEFSDWDPILHTRVYLGKKRE